MAHDSNGLLGALGLCRKAGNYLIGVLPYQSYIQHSYSPFIVVILSRALHITSRSSLP